MRPGRRLHGVDGNAGAEITIAAGDSYRVESGSFKPAGDPDGPNENEYTFYYWLFGYLNTRPNPTPKIPDFGNPDPTWTWKLTTPKQTRKPKMWIFDTENLKPDQKPENFDKPDPNPKILVIAKPDPNPKVRNLTTRTNPKPKKSQPE